MKSQIISSMLSFTLGTGATLVALSSWLGTSDLQEIKDSVSNYVLESEQQASALVQDYQVTVDNANAEIGAYKQALAQANSNIDKLITAYEEEQAQAEQDLAELEYALSDMQVRLNQQYEADMNEIIEQANAQIEQANAEVLQTNLDVQAIIEGSHIEDIVNGEKSVLDTTGDKSVTDISSIVPSEQPQE